MDLDRIVNSWMDFEASKNEFRREIANELKIPISDIEVSVDSEYTGVVHQYLVVDINERLTKDDLDRLDFDFIDNYGNLVWEIGDIVL